MRFSSPLFTILLGVVASVAAQGSCGTCPSGYVSTGATCTTAACTCTTAVRPVGSPPANCLYRNGFYQYQNADDGQCPPNTCNCDPGYGVTSSATCQKCTGFFASTGGSNSCNQCPSGQTPDPNNAACGQYSPVGTQCVARNYDVDQGTCDMGLVCYLNGGRARCGRGPAGTTCASTSTCADNTVCSNGQCTSCGSGTRTGSATSCSCNTGAVASSSSSPCVTCTGDTYADTSTNFGNTPGCKPCFGNKVPSADHASCVCAPGSAPESFANCRACAGNSIPTGSGFLQTCTSCGAGTANSAHTACACFANASKDGQGLCSCDTNFQLSGGVCSPISTPSQRRVRRAQVQFACPPSDTLCPLGNSGNGECLDISQELTSCGGCSSIDPRFDCTRMPHADRVGCASGRCMLFSCQTGYRVKHGRCVRVSEL